MTNNRSFYLWFTPCTHRVLNCIWIIALILDLRTEGKYIEASSYFLCFDSSWLSMQGFIIYLVDKTQIASLIGRYLVKLKHNILDIGLNEKWFSCLCRVLNCDPNQILSTNKSYFTSYTKAFKKGIYKCKTLKSYVSCCRGINKNNCR